MIHEYMYDAGLSRAIKEENQKMDRRAANRTLKLSQSGVGPTQKLDTGRPSSRGSNRGSRPGSSGSARGPKSHRSNGSNEGNLTRTKLPGQRYD